MEPAFPVSDRETQTKACPECGALVTACDHLYAIPKSGPFLDEGKALPAGSKQSTPERENGPEIPSRIRRPLHVWRARNVLPGERFCFSARFRIFGRVYWIEGSW